MPPTPAPPPKKFTPVEYKNPPAEKSVEDQIVNVGITAWLLGFFR